jgi:hypothetical protein
MNKTVVIRNKIIILLTVAFLVLAIISISPSKATPRTLIIPDDHPTIQSAIGNATDGDIILVRKGIYEGPWNETVFINKTISLIGEDPSTTILRLHPLWYELFILGQCCGWTFSNSAQIQANNVIISGFTIESDGGNLWINGDNAKITGNIIKTIFQFNGSRGVCAYNTITQGLYPNGTANLWSRGNVECIGSYVQVASNIIANGSISIMGSYASVFANRGVGSIRAGGTSDSNLIYNNTLHDSGGIWGASTHLTIAKNAVVNSITDGLSIAWGYYNTVWGNTAIGCTGAGLLEIDNAGANTFVGNQIANCTWGAKIAASGSTTHNTTLYDNNFLDNTWQVNTEKNETVSSAGMNFTRSLNHGGFFDNGEVGNYWSNYVGEDANGDGVGDTPYIIDENRSDHYPLMQPFETSSLNLPLPVWANIALPDPPPQIAFPPQPSNFPYTTPMASTSSVTEKPSQTPLQSLDSNSNIEPSPSIPELQTWIIFLLMLATITALTLTFLKLKSSFLQELHT